MASILAAPYKNDGFGAQKTTWPLLELLYRQTIAISKDPKVISELQCNTIEILRSGLKTLKLDDSEVTIQQVREGRSVCFFFVQRKQHEAQELQVNLCGAVDAGIAKLAERSGLLRISLVFASSGGGRGRSGL